MANRHDLYIWPFDAQPLPDTLEQARDIAENLAEQSAPLTANMLTLIEKTKAYIATQSSQFKDSYRFFDKDTQAKACLILTLPSYGWEQGLHFIVQTAIELKLAVYDPELRMAFLKDEVLPAEAEDYWLGLCEYLEDSDFPKNDKAFADWFEPKLAAMLAKYGFSEREITTEEYIKYFDNLSNKYYVRSIAHGEQHVFVGYDAHRYIDDYRPYVHLGVLLPCITDITNRFNFEKPHREGGGYTYYDTFQVDKISHTNITSYELAFKFISFIEDKLLALANKTTTLCDLNTFLQQDKKTRMHVHPCFTPFTTVLAYLTNAPDFNELGNRLANINFGHAPDDYRINYQTKYAKLLKYLREEVKPLI